MEPESHRTLGNWGFHGSHHSALIPALLPQMPENVTTPPRATPGQQSFEKPPETSKGELSLFSLFHFPCKEINKSMGFQLGNSPKELREFWGLQ